MEQEQVKTNLSNTKTWTRLLFILVCAVLLWISACVLSAVVVAQFLFVLLSGERNANLARFSSALAQYIFQLVEYITFNSDDRPFPWAPFPDEESDI